MQSACIGFFKDPLPPPTHLSHFNTWSFSHQWLPNHQAQLLSLLLEILHHCISAGYPVAKPIRFTSAYPESQILCIVGFGRSNIQAPISENGDNVMDFLWGLNRMIHGNYPTVSGKWPALTIRSPMLSLAMVMVVILVSFDSLFFLPLVSGIRYFPVFILNLCLHSCSITKTSNLLLCSPGHETVPTHIVVHGTNTTAFWEISLPEFFTHSHPFPLLTQFRSKIHW